MNSGIKNGKSSDKSFKKLLIGIAAFSVGLILIILTVFVWIPEIKYGKDTLQQVDDPAASLYDEKDSGAGREVLKADDPDPAPEPEPVIEKVSDGNFQITMSTEWNYQNISTPAEDSYVENSVSNSYETVFTVVLAEDESFKIYESPRMPVGSFLKEIPIKADLEPGSYDCIVKYALYKPGEDTEAGTVRVSLKLNILS